MENNNNEQERDMLSTARTRLFHSLFFRISLAYSRACPKYVRRIIECVLLMKAIVCLSLLVYIHFTYSRQPVQCLEHIADSWPRDGILRVEIQKGVVSGYDINASYEKEKRLALRQRELEQYGSLLYMLTGEIGLFDPPEDDDDLASTDLDESARGEDRTAEGSSPEASGEPSETNETQMSLELSEELTSNISQKNKISTLSTTIDDMKDRLNSLEDVLQESELTEERLDSTSEYGRDIGAQASKLKTVTVNMTDTLNEDERPVELGTLQIEEEEDKFSRMNMEEGYIVEYSLEIGFLKLSPTTRQKLNIPVHIEILDPMRDKCFGDAFSRFLLEHVLGYEDVLMSSIKSLAEKEHNKGYLRNVVNNAQYHFVSRWSNATSYLSATFIMIIFTISISMLLRYSQHQIFVFIVDLLQTTEFNTNVTFPAAPLLTVILALVGMEAIMSEFFEDTTTAFYIIVMVWICDQYDSICCHTPITKRYWLRFFYLYHTAFYAYHYRFSGQYSGMALATMWLFTQHSMVYFFHHYELPVILQQAQIRDILMGHNQQNVGAAQVRNNNNANNRNNNNFSNNNNNNNDNNVNNNNQSNNNVANGRPALRGRVRGFTLGAFRYRFGVVFNRNQQQEGTEIAEPSQGQGNDDVGSQALRYADEIAASTNEIQGMHQTNEQQEENRRPAGTAESSSEPTESLYEMLDRQFREDGRLGEYLPDSSEEEYYNPQDRPRRKTTQELTSTATGSNETEKVISIPDPSPSSLEDSAAEKQKSFTSPPSLSTSSQLSETSLLVASVDTSPVGNEIDAAGERDLTVGPTRTVEEDRQADPEDHAFDGDKSGSDSDDEGDDIVMNDVDMDEIRGNLLAAAQEAAALRPQSHNDEK